MPHDKQAAIRMLDKQIALFEEAARLPAQGDLFENDIFHRAYYGTENIVARLFSEDERMKFRSAVRSYGHGYDGYIRHIRNCISQLQVYKEEIENLWPDAPNGDAEPQKDTLATLSQLAKSLPAVIHELRQRHANRATLDVSDEYDLQDLVRSLLYISFEDVRKEEGTPSLAGVNGRADFLLYSEKTVVELKMTRQGLKNKELKEQLSSDKPHYFKHPDCKTLVAIVYDPSRLINNPRGAETDLGTPYNGMSVHVFIVQG